MLKNLFIAILNLYQKVISPLLHQLLGVQSACRYSPTCSEYAKESIQKKGVLGGSYLAIKRLLSCQPFGQLNISNKVKA